MRKQLVGLTLILSLWGQLLFINPTRTHAQCDPPPDGSTATCEATGTEAVAVESMEAAPVESAPASEEADEPYVLNGIQASDNAVIIVEDGTYVQANENSETEGKDGIHAGHNATIHIADEAGVSATAGDAIDVKNDAMITNEGQISGLADHGIETGDNLTYTQTGDQATLHGDLDAINTGDNATITISGDTSITANRGDLIDAGDNADITVVTTGEQPNLSQRGDGIEANYSANITIANGEEGNTTAIDAYCDGVKAGDLLIMTNEGNINSRNCNIIDAGHFASIDNHGTLTNSEGNLNAGVLVGDYARISNTGEIHTECKGIKGDEYIVAVNNGTILSESCDGIAAESAIAVSNNGTLEAADDGIDIGFGDVFNSGTITAVDDGVVMSGGTTGYIDDPSDLASTEVTNTGTIVGEIAVNLTKGGNMDAEHVQNEGTLIGTGGIAVDLGAGNDFFSGGIGHKQDTVIESEAQGIIDGGSNEDEFIIDYHYNQDDTAAEQEYSRIEEIASNASTQNCPCTLSFTVMGLTFNYTYTNFERVSSRRFGWQNTSSSTAAAEPAAETMLLSAAAPEVVEQAAPVAETVAAETAVVEAAPVVEVAAPAVAAPAVVQDVAAVNVPAAVEVMAAPAAVAASAEAAPIAFSTLSLSVDLRVW